MARLPRIYLETKDMTHEELSEYYRKKTESVIKEYGMKVVSRVEG